ncbi:cytochrome c class I [Hydrogenobacter thermophilus TK-6]|uniref:Cytochrome c n=1 Tax=Hydrogenobacter thermophilus (strain DSM 6534 / IAM 12695 / TK-6) TaxID=608538 RepID=D3DFM9_HYDTT|nr:cytochrome c [Hydrogenobacter thermophilus]ADO44575.1 cytochrome c class I [Hydrogenobacter thermophilus TK-6]BAI68631.1 cytochrome c [Hydrogenobacter thermophilus TK-6]
MKKAFLLISLSGLLLFSCKEKPPEAPATPPEKPKEEAVSDKGIGPIKEVQLGPVDQNLVKRGKEIFDSKCATCHKLEERYVGPPLKGVTKRRKPEWIMNMILNPTEMEQKDPIAKQLLSEYLTQMTFQNVSQEDARAILEYLRSVDEK